MLTQLLEMGSPPLGAGEMCARAVVALIYGTIVVRLFGRRIFARWSALDVVIAISMGSTLSRAITGPIAFWPAVAATTLMLLLHRGLALLCVRSPAFARFVEGRSVVLAANGTLDPSAMQRWGVSEADLREALRTHGLERVEQTRQIALEPNGLISLKAD